MTLYKQYQHFEEINFLPPHKTTTFNPHVLIAGKSGTGKSNTAEWITLQNYGKTKIIDLNDDGRFENCLYGLPETNPYLITKLETFTNERITAQAFPNQVILPAGTGLEYVKELPNNFLIISINPKELKLSTLIDLLATTEGAKTVLGFLDYTYGNMDLLELQNWLETNTEDKTVPPQVRYLLLRTIRNWLNSGIFNNKFPRLDMKKLLKDRQTITSFSTYLLELPEQKSFFHSFVLKEILQAKKRQDFPHEVVLLVREISHFIGRYAERHSQEAQLSIERIIREGRDLGIKLICDTQRLKDLPPLFRRQFGKIIQLAGDFADAQTLLEIQHIHYRVLQRIPHLHKGEGLLLTGSQYYYPLFFPPTPIRHKRPNENVIELLKHKFGSYKVQEKYPASQLLENKTITPVTTKTLELQGKEEPSNWLEKEQVFD